MRRARVSACRTVRPPAGSGGLVAFWDAIAEKQSATSRRL